PSSLPLTVKATRESALLAKGLSLSRTALNRDVVFYCPKARALFQSPERSGKHIPELCGGFKEQNEGKDANTTPIKDVVMNEVASGELFNIRSEEMKYTAIRDAELSITSPRVHGSSERHCNEGVQSLQRNTRHNEERRGNGGFWGSW
ncbi:GTP cyclohydrolase 1 2, partial [Dissostichus eleginoides]